MSSVTRRKHILKAIKADDYKLPKKNQLIVRVVRRCRSNIFEVEAADEDDEHFLVKMPTKFRNNFWIKRGDYILVDPIEGRNKVKGEICNILFPGHIRKYVMANIWPTYFGKKNNIGNIKNFIKNKYVMRIIIDDTDEDDIDDDDDVFSSEED